MVSIHGLIRGHDLELGRDADTGGQTKYVVELARALGQLDKVTRVDLLTRLISDPQLDPDYARDREALSDNVHIVRIPCGGDRYIAKEKLWDSLDSFADNALSFFNRQPYRPDLIHSHYADAGYVGTLLSAQLSVPLIHTGHSLGRSKRKRLLAAGLKDEQIERLYTMSRRIEAEEMTLGVAERVITSTYQEIDQQYRLYDYYQPEQMRVIPPGTDLQQFHPPRGDEADSAIAAEINRFLREPGKPLVLALSRPDRRKNITTLIEAYGQSKALQKIANLAIVAGNRDDISEIDAESQQVFCDIFATVDRFDLYGKVAYPKRHRSEDVSTIYRYAALLGGVFVNPALTEPFGLTLLEAAACGLPLVATEDGGPVDIIKNCANGVLVDPLDSKEMAEKILALLRFPANYRRLAASGLKGVEQHYAWWAHAKKYMSVVEEVVSRTRPLSRKNLVRRPTLHHDRAIFTDLDQSLLGDTEGVRAFVQAMEEHKKLGAFGIATGRRLDSALRLLKQHRIPLPDVLISSLGTEIAYSSNLINDDAWVEHIDYLWQPGRIRKLFADMTGLKLQSRMEQSRFKISYFYDPTRAPCVEEIRQMLHQNECVARVIVSFGQFLDILPVRASKGLALRWFVEQWGVSLENVLAAGGSGADEDMIRGNTLGVVVANRHNEELPELTDQDRVYYAQQPHAWGILEAMQYFDFWGRCKEPQL